MIINNVQLPKAQYNCYGQCPYSHFIYMVEIMDYDDGERIFSTIMDCAGRSGRPDRMNNNILLTKWFIAES